MKQIIFATVILSAIVFSANAERYKYEEKRSKNDVPPGTAANCTPATAATELDINNTRALIQSGGDMWWDFNRSRYEIPKGSEQTSLYAGSLWLAGQDVSGQFKVAALRFRRGNDYWTGPLSTVDAEITPGTCSEYDRHWETTRSMVSEFSAWYQAGQDDDLNGTNTQAELYPGYTIPSAITEWPAHGRNFEPYNEDYYLAPFFDRDGDGDYNPEEDGDYPGYVLVGKSDCSRRVRDIYGDQNIWWVFNDKGNIHSESGGQAIGMEIRAQAFAFATTDEVNNMTFYNYELINRSTFSLADTYFGQWADGDVGNAQDDYVGCDVRRGLGYFYNGDNNDEDASGNVGYGTNPPAIGIDFFQGPFQKNDSRDNCLCTDYSSAIEEDGIVYSGQGAGYGDGIVDNERYGMRKFLYHINQPGPVGDPGIATDYYNMLRGIWKDGTPMTYGGNGYDPSNPNAIEADYMFPGDTDPLHWGTKGIDPGYDWSEISAGNQPGDRRFVQSSGPFELAPGAVNNITVGVVWMKAISGGPQQSVADMRTADDKTQALFDSCFEILDGPHAPEVAVQELDREVILMLSNPINSNNYREGYATVDPFQAAPDSVDSDDDGLVDLALTAEEKRIYATYKFEGYQIFQLADGSVGTNDLEDPDLARLVAQVDVENDVDRLMNFEFNSTIAADEPKLRVEGENKGIEHSFKVTTDLFAEGDGRLINHKTYYFMVIAYAYNQFGDGFGNLQHVDGIYDPAADPPRLEGQKIPYLASRTSPNGPVKVYEAIPHRTDIEQNGIILNSQYGDGVELTRVEGRGNGGNYSVIKEDYLDSAASNFELERAAYAAGAGPVKVKVVDPLMVQPGQFTLAFKDTSSSGDLSKMFWELSGDGIEVVNSEQSVRQGNEQVISELGISINASYGYPATVSLSVDNSLILKSSTNGYIGFDVIYEDETDQWLGGVVDVDATPAFNWIKSGTTLAPFPEGADFKDDSKDDHRDDFAKLGQADDAGEPLDPEQNWENIAGRTWAPFALCSYDTAHPIPYFGANTVFAEDIIEWAGLHNTPSIDVVITDNKDLWTRCPVLEAGDNSGLTQGGASRGELRCALSVDKSGRNSLDPDYNASEATLDGTQVLGDFATALPAAKQAYLKNLTGLDNLRSVSIGMGWFPGYAINIETGERLNMAFSEDSWLKNENGGDMLWNPTDKLSEQLFGELRLGGKHMIYVFRHNVEDAGLIESDMLMPAYDHGDFAFSKMVRFDPTDPLQIIGTTNARRIDYMSVMRSGAWVGYPMVAEGSKLFGGAAGNQGSDNFNKVTVQLRSTQSYAPYAVGDEIAFPGGSVKAGTTYYVKSGQVVVPQTPPDTTVAEDITFSAGQVFTAEASTVTLLSLTASLIETVNGGLPLYNFNLDDLAPAFDATVGEDALDDISVVPNPYYAYSKYEEGRLDYLVKVVNLPEECTINIFTINGVLVRTFNKDNASITSVDWDLKNQDDIPIASGMYMIHINAPGIGERVIKWFGVLRPLDLNSF